METTIQNYDTVEATIEMSNISINPKNRKASLTVGIKKGRQRKFRYMELENVSVAKELIDWLMIRRPVKEKVAADNDAGYTWEKVAGKTMTGYEKYLEKCEIEQGTRLHDIVFSCANQSDQYLDNPFRLAVLNDYSILTMVTVPSKKKVSYVNPQTGESTDKFYQKIGTFGDGTKVQAFIRPEKYRRLVLQNNKTVEVFEQPEQATA